MDRADGLAVIVVGGAGAMGRYAVRSISRLGTARRLIIADKNVEYAKRLSAEVGPPCEALELDATDPEALRRAFADCDVVCSTMGPFAVFGRPILEAALESRCSYLDIDDDWQSTIEAFELHDLAVANNVTAVIGMGSSPGFSNMLAMLAVEDLDSVEGLYTGWNLASAVVEVEDNYPPSMAASAAVEHWLLQCSGQIRVWQDGAYADVTPAERMVLQLPGFGERVVHTMGHPEPITLPRSVPGLRRALNVQVGPEWIFDHLRSVAADYDAGRISLQEGARRLAHPVRPGSRAGERQKREKRLPYNWALAEGTKAGRARSVMTYSVGEPRGRMGGQTGVPLAIGAEFLRRGQIKDRGVLSPEAAIDPHEFFELFAEFLEPPICPVLSGERAVVRVESPAEE